MMVVTCVANVHVLHISSITVVSRWLTSAHVCPCAYASSSCEPTKRPMYSCSSNNWPVCRAFSHCTSYRNLEPSKQSLVRPPYNRRCALSSIYHAPPCPLSVFDVCAQAWPHWLRLKGSRALIQLDGLRVLTQVCPRQHQAWQGVCLHGLLQGGRSGRRSWQLRRP